MAASTWQARLIAFAIGLAATCKAQAAYSNSSATVTSMASLPTGQRKVCEFAAGSVMIWDWHDAHTAATITHTIVPHITAYPNGSSVTNNETVLATATLPTNVSVSSTRVVSGFTMTYPSIWAEYSYFYSADCAVSTSTDIVSEFTHTVTDYGTPPSYTSTETYPERTQLYTIQSGKGITLPATTDPARFFYRAEGWDYDTRNPATVTPAMLEYLAGLETVVEQMTGQDVRTCIFATCAATAVGHSMVSATVLVESTEVGQAFFHTAAGPSTSPSTPPANTPEVTPPTTPPATQQTPPVQDSPSTEQQQQQPSPAPAEPEVSPPAQSSVVVIVPSIEISGGAAATTRAATGETTLVRTTTVGGQVEEQTVISPAPIATPPPGEVTLIREVTSNGQVSTETIVSVSAAASGQASEVTFLTTVTGSDGAPSTLTMVSISNAAGPQPSEVTLVRTTTSGGAEVVQTIVSISPGNQDADGSDGGPTGAAQQTLAQETSTRTIVSNGQTYVQTVVSPVETGGSPGETTFVRTTTSDGATFAQTVVSPLPSGSGDGNQDGGGTATLTTGGSAGSAYTGPAVVGGASAQNICAGKGLAVVAVVIAVQFMIDV
ncbi:hypothetical protein Daus18300_004996 [Diaporthe australafricana]|uniref:Uncharacterized protein n=1 Tax=Diaporthe australafricana TaxID=127596 RepID=A0ABR3X406_9PEZI